MKLHHPAFYLLQSKRRRFVSLCGKEMNANNSTHYVARNDGLSLQQLVRHVTCDNCTLMLDRLEELGALNFLNEDGPLGGRVVRVELALPFVVSKEKLRQVLLQFDHAELVALNSAPLP